MKLFFRFTIVALFALWMGGFVFYTSFVVPIVKQVDGATGHITQHVAVRFNNLGVAALIIFSAFLWFERREPYGRKSAALLVGLGLLLQAGLIGWHPVVLAADDAGDDAQFYFVHRVYLWLATLQFIAVSALMWLELARWRKIDVRKTELFETPPTAGGLSA